MKPKFLLTGASGTLGSAIRAEAKDDFEIVGLDINTGGDSQIHQGSFTDAAAVEPLLQGCDAVIHTAAMHGGHRNTHTPTQYAEVNVGGMVTLLELCIKHGVKRFVFSSTMEVLIGYDWAASGMAVFDELSTPNPDWIIPATEINGILQVCIIIGIASNCVASPLQRQRRFPATSCRSYALPPNIWRHVVSWPTRFLTSGRTRRSRSTTSFKQRPILTPLSKNTGPVQRQLCAPKTLRSSNFWPVTRIDKAKRILGWQPQTTFEGYLQSLGWKMCGQK